LVVELGVPPFCQRPWGVRPKSSPRQDRTHYSTSPQKFTYSHSGQKPR